MLKPLADRILVRVDAEETQTKGGIQLPDTAQKKQQRGIVVALGTGKVLDNGTRQAFDVKVGDHVIFDKYTGVDIDQGDGEKYLLLGSRDLLAILD